MGAVVDGGFESVLDEHFWLRAQNLHGGGRWPHQGSDNCRSGFVPAALAFMESIDGRTRYRCDAMWPCRSATPRPNPIVKVAGGEAQAAPVRPDEVRRSFNTPFWPHVLATTSVGQEGLDFHPWCSRVVHWDLSSNPLDLEQREGRIQRYAGLAVRRRLSDVLREEVLNDPAMAEGSPWRCVQRHAERFVDESGLRPLVGA